MRIGDFVKDEETGQEIPEWAESLKDRESE